MANPNLQRILLPNSHSAPDNTVISRPPSSASRRPATSASLRPSSSLSNRPVSRLSHHAQTRQVRSRLIPLCQSLVTRMTGVQDDDDHFQTLVESAFQRLESTSQVKAAAIADFSAIDKRMSGFIKRAKIDMHGSLAEAFSSSYTRLKTQAPLLHDLDEKIKSSRLPQHMQLLIELSAPASQSSLAYAEIYLDNLRNPLPPPLTVTWEQILAEEPFTGDHWECLKKRGQDSHSDSASSLSLSIWSSDGEYDHQLGHTEPSSHSTEDDYEVKQDSTKINGEPSLHDKLLARELVEDLQAQQYWNNKHVFLGPSSLTFDLGNHLTLGHSLQAAIRTRSGIGLVQQSESWIQEQDAVREVLMALQGRRSILFDGPTQDDPCVKVISNCPRFLHLSLSSQFSLLTSFAAFSTTVASLRRFSFQILSQPLLHNLNSRTLEAYADAVANEVRQLDGWAAQREELIVKACAGLTSEGSAGGVVSLLDIEYAMKNNFDDVFDALHTIVDQVQSQVNATPAFTTTLILDLLTQGVEQQRLLGNDLATKALFRVFIRTAEPLWSMVGSWLKNGMKADDNAEELDEEFFIQKTVSSNFSNVFDPDFWANGYILRSEESTSDTSPAFLLHVSQTILQCGKTTGLLRLMDAPGLEGFEISWPSFQVLLSSQSETHTTTSATTGYLSYLVSDKTSYYFSSVNAALIDFLVDECDMWQHIHAIEDIYFLRRGDSMTDFMDVLFSKMDMNQDWRDFHFLNSSFRDIVELRSHRWVEAALVRLSYHATRELSIQRTISALDGLAIEYAVPFPLTYVFSPAVMSMYGEVLIFLLQLKRAKYVLEKILVRSHSASVVRGRDVHLKVLYSLRSRLSWFINTILNFVLTYVIHAEVSRFHSALRQASSLDEILHIHDNHLDIVMGRCLLHKRTFALHRAILSILDIALQFSEIFISIAGDTTSDCNQTLLLNHRKRRRHVRRNVVGFAPPDTIHHSDSESDEELQGEAMERAIEPSTLDSRANEDKSARIEKMSLDLDSLVKFVRRGIETLAGGPSGAAPAFGVLNFTLEDWDIRGNVY